MRLLPAKGPAGWSDPAATTFATPAFNASAALPASLSVSRLPWVEALRQAFPAKQTPVWRLQQMSCELGKSPHSLPPSLSRVRTLTFVPNTFQQGFMVALTLG